MNGQVIAFVTSCQIHAIINQKRKKKIVTARRGVMAYQSASIKSIVKYEPSTTHRLILRDALNTRLIVVLDEGPDVERAVVELTLDLLCELGDDG